LLHRWLVLHCSDRSWGYLGVRHIPSTESLRGRDKIFLLGWTRDLRGSRLDAATFTAGETSKSKWGMPRGTRCSSRRWRRHQEAGAKFGEIRGPLR
ncbi:hypothetical protein CTAM01_15651, partial [Colletotrichum tamarilloi]